MAFPKYQTKELLNKILNSAETAIQVDIVAGAEYAEDAAHTSADTGNFVLGVRNDTLAALGGTDGDYVPFQMNSSGALFVDIADGGQLDTIIDTLETTLTAIETDAAAIEVLLTAANVDHAAIEVLLTAANVDHAANEVLLTGIDADTNAIKVDMAAIEVLLTAANVAHAANEALLTTIDSDTNDIKTDIAALEVLSTAANVDLAEIEVATEASQAALEKMLYGNALAVTAVDGGSTHALGATYEALYVGVGGDAVVTMVGTGNFTFKNLASGQLLPIRFTHVINTNTTATHMIALKA